MRIGQSIALAIIEADMPSVPPRLVSDLPCEIALPMLKLRFISVPKPIVNDGPIIYISGKRCSARRPGGGSIFRVQISSLLTTRAERVKLISGEAETACSDVVRFSS